MGGKAVAAVLLYRNDASSSRDESVDSSSTRMPRGCRDRRRLPALLVLVRRLSSVHWSVLPAASGSGYEVVPAHNYAYIRRHWPQDAWRILMVCAGRWAASGCRSPRPKEVRLELWFDSDRRRL